MNMLSLISVLGRTRFHVVLGMRSHLFAGFWLGVIRFSSWSPSIFMVSNRSSLSHITSSLTSTSISSHLPLLPDHSLRNFPCF